MTLSALSVSDNIMIGKILDVLDKIFTHSVSLKGQDVERAY